MISVIIPAFNAEKYITRAIRSVQEQSFNDVEIIIINDGSTDKTLQICEDLQRTDDRILIYTKKNGGLSSARNYGIELSHGKYLAFLDADDLYLSDFLEVMFLAIENNDATMAVCGYFSVDENGLNKKPSGIFDTTVVLKKSDAVAELILGKKLSSHSWNKLYRREMFETIRYPIGKNYEDMYIMPELLDNCNCVVFVPKHLMLYFQISSSITHIPSLRNECNAFEAAYNRYTHYLYDYSNLFCFLVKEPLEIALRLYCMNKHDNKELIYYEKISDLVDQFILKCRRNYKSYIRLTNKYRSLLFLAPLLKDKVNYEK